MKGKPGTPEIFFASQGKHTTRSWNRLKLQDFIFSNKNEPLFQDFVHGGWGDKDEVFINN